MDRFMALLCRHAEAIAALDDLMKDPDNHAQFSTQWGRVDTSWFRAHLGHQLLPIDEYGQFLGACHGWASCDAGHNHPCQLERNHDGPHSSKKP